MTDVAAIGAVGAGHPCVPSSYAVVVVHSGGNVAGIDAGGNVANVFGEPSLTAATVVVGCKVIAGCCGAVLAVAAGAVVAGSVTTVVLAGTVVAAVLGVTLLGVEPGTAVVGAALDDELGVDVLLEVCVLDDV